MAEHADTACMPNLTCYCVKMFQEADNWTTLGADMEEVFQSQDVEKV